MRNNAANQKLIELLYQVNRLMRQKMEFDSSLTQLTMIQIETLIFIKHAVSIQMGDVSEKFHITMPSATSLVNTLVTLKLVQRKNDPSDRRIVKIELTKKGEELIQKAMNAKQKTMKIMLAYLTAEQKVAMAHSLETILSNINDEKHEKK